MISLMDNSGLKTHKEGWEAQSDQAGNWPRHLLGFWRALVLAMGAKLYQLLWRTLIGLQGTLGKSFLSAAVVEGHKVENLCEEKVLVGQVVAR